MSSPAALEIDGPPANALAPLRNSTFRSLWLSTQISGLGWLIQSVAISWLMVTISPSALMVALVQASSTLPAFLLSIFIGAVTDIFSHRAVMIFGRCLVVTAFAILTLLLAIGISDPWTILALSFLAGCGSAFVAPAWQASVGDIVPRRDVPAAVVLISAGFNTIRSVGPALGGILVASFGPFIALLLATLSNIFPFLALWRHKWQGPNSPFPREPLMSAMADGLRFTAMSSNLKVTITRGTLVGTAGVAFLALLPLLVRNQLAGGPLDFGIVMAGFGSGALIAAAFHSTLRRRLSQDHMIFVATIACTACSACLTLTSSLWIATGALALGGAGWVALWSELGVSAQLASPRWVVGRTLSVYYAFTYGGLAAGSWLWGLVAENMSLTWALGGSSVAILLASLLGLFFPIQSENAADLDPLERIHAPALAHDLKPRSGPIVVQTEYVIAPEELDRFLAIMRERRPALSRAGARLWNLRRDLVDASRWIETYRTPTWTDYLRLNHRLTATDHDLNTKLMELHVQENPPTPNLSIERPLDPVRRSGFRRPPISHP